MLGHGLDNAEEWVRSWTAQVSARAEASTALADKVSAMSVMATGSDGAIQVTVAGSGVMIGLELDDRVQRMPGARLSAQILLTMRRAQARLSEQVAAAVSQTVGVDSETGRAVVASFERRFPTPPDEDADQSRSGEHHRAR